MGSILLLYLWSSAAFGFVLLSGPSEAKLECSPNEPVVEFLVDINHPKISGKGKFLGGKYADLPDGDFWLAVVAEAMAEWNSVYGSYVKLSMTTGSPSADAEDEIHSIVVAEDDSFSSAASASPKIEDDKILDCDIRVGKKSAGEASSLAYTLLHELGHCLGLGHNHTNYDAVMGYSRSSRTLKLGADDKAGVIYLYPDPDVVEDPPKELISCGTLGFGGHSGLSFLLLLLPIILPILLRFR